jgi:hypothetical protein
MRFISHRGNIYGREIESENLPSKIEECLNLGFEAEVDVWKINDTFWLGHDEPMHQVSIEFLRRDKIWSHAKNFHALESLLADVKVHSFWHQEDDYTITSKGIAWVYPGKILINNSVCVMPERTNYSIKNLSTCLGICSDNIFKYKSLISEQRA